MSLIKHLFVPIAAATSVACGGPASHATSGGDSGNGSSSSVSIPATGPIPENLGPAAVAQAICQKVQQCGCAVFAQSEPCVQDSVCSAATCVSDFTTLYQNADTAAQATGRVYDPQGARQCVDAVANAGCLDVDYTNLCTVMWNGTQAIGQSCSATLACETSDAAPAECSADAGCVPISNAPPAGPPQGAPCSGTCVGTTCVVVITSGSSGGQCQHDNGLSCLSGTCQPALSQGASCSTGYGFPCADPLACVGGICSARIANGGACSGGGTVDDPCVAGSGCLGSACATLKADGQMCGSDYECSSLRCSSSGICLGKYASPICGG